MTPIDAHAILSGPVARAARTGAIEDTALQNTTLATPRTAPAGAGTSDGFAALPIGGAETALPPAELGSPTLDVPDRDAAYPPLDAGEADARFREGRPLRMCPHGHVRDQGDYCSRCDW